MQLTNPTHQLETAHRLMTEAGFADVRLVLSADHEFVEYWFRASADLRGMNYDAVYARLLRTLRASGFKVGFEELALDFDGEFGQGGFLVAPLADICAGDKTSVESELRNST